MIILLFRNYRQIVLSVISTTTRLIAAFMRENYRSYMVWQQNYLALEKVQNFCTSKKYFNLLSRRIYQYWASITVINLYVLK
jgi:hypothetical protein